MEKNCFSVERFHRWNEIYLHNEEKRIIYSLYVVNMGFLCRNDLATILYAY